MLLILFSMVLGVIFDFYYKYVWYEYFINIFTGLLFSLIGIYYLNKYKLIFPKITKGVLIFTISLGLVILFKTSEYIIDELLGVNIHTLEEVIIRTFDYLFIHIITTLIVVILISLDSYLFKDKLNKLISSMKGR